MTCPRCFGPMFPESDIHGEYRTCMCCGYVSYAEPPAPWVQETRRMGHRGKQARTLARERSRA